MQRAALPRYGFETLRLGTIHAVTLPGYERSMAVARRLGMRYTGRTKRSCDGTELERCELARPEPGD